GVDLVVSGHDHMYERFGPQNPDGQADDAFGIRQFTAGTGGAEFYAVSQVQPNSEVIINDTHASWCSHWIRTTTRGRSRAWIARSSPASASAVALDPLRPSTWVRRTTIVPTITRRCSRRAPELHSRSRRREGSKRAPSCPPRRSTARRSPVATRWRACTRARSP